MLILRITRTAQQPGAIPDSGTGFLEGESTGMTSRPAGLGWSTAQRLSGAGGAERSREPGMARKKGKGDEGADRWGRLVSRRQIARGLRKRAG